jgi:hypothetical protein
VGISSSFSLARCTGIRLLQVGKERKDYHSKSTELYLLLKRFL